MNQALINALRKLHHSGHEGFEGLIAKLLEALTGRHFYLAQAGTQLGRDMSSSGTNAEVIAVECKRYGSKTALDERELLGELVQVAKAIPDLDLWILVASRDIPSQLHEALRSAANDYNITYLSISSGDGTPSSLEILCAQAPDQVFQYLKDEPNKVKIQKELANVYKSKDFNKKLSRLRSNFTSSLIGYNNWRESQNHFFIQCLQSKIDSYAEFNQLINIEEESTSVIRRERAWESFDEWISSWKNTKQMLAVIGEEGDGKTWSVASWLSHKIRTVAEFPPVLFLSSNSVAHTQPETLVSELIARRFHNFDQERWRIRIERWLRRDNSDTPLLLIVLDGINERRNFSWWRELLSRFSSKIWSSQVAIIITCRLGYWNRVFVTMSELHISTHCLQPYDEHELNEALEQYSLKRSDIQEDVLELICKPRYFDLMVKYRERVSGTGDVNAARLIYEDWRDRLQRNRNIPYLNDEQFRQFISRISLKYREKSQYVTEQDIDSVLPRFIEDRFLLFEELQTNGILQYDRQNYRVNEKFLILGFGLLLANQLEEAFELPGKDLSEVILEWLEPHAEMDIKSAICGSAALHVLSLRDYPKEAKVALLQAWIYSQNPEQSIEHDFIAYSFIDLECYIELAELVWSDTAENAWAQELLMRAFLQQESPSSVSLLRSAFERWLSFVHVHGSPLVREPLGRGAKRLKEEITERLGCVPQAGQEVEFGNLSVVVIDDDGLLRLGRVAIAVISHLPRNAFLHAIATGCLAEAIMGIPSKHALFAWVFESSPNSLGKEVLEEVNYLIALDNHCAQQAAYRLLSFEGSSEAFRLRQTLPQDLFPISPDIEQHKQDPCNSWFEWSRAECEFCVSKEDLSIERIARKLKPHCINPNLSVPSSLAQRLELVIESVSVENIRTSLFQSRDDHLLKEYEPALCAYASETMAKLACRIALQIEEREDLPLHYLAFRLSEYSLLFTIKESNTIYHTWEKLVRNHELWDDKQRLSEALLFQLVLNFRNAEEQLYLLIDRPDEAMDLLKFENNLLSIQNWEFIRRILVKGSNDKTIQRILWLLSLQPELIPDDVYTHQVLPLLSCGDHLTSALVLQILYLSNNQEAIQFAIEKNWSYSNSNDEFWQEVHWGSLLLSKYGTSLTYSELSNRIHPIYLGYAIQHRGALDEEVNQYSANIQTIWLGLDTRVPDLPMDFPVMSIMASVSDPRDVCMIHGVSISNALSSQTVVFLNRDASWGGIQREASQGLEEVASLESHNQNQRSLRQIADDTIKQQTEAGNIWFAKRFFSNCLERIIKEKPDLLGQWLDVVLTDNPRKEKYLILGYSFYEALCTTLLKVSPEQGLDLYWTLKETDRKIYIKDEYSEMELIDYALFQAPISDASKQAWEKKLQLSKNNRDILELVILAQNSKRDVWLWSVIEEGIESIAPLKKSRSIMLLAFIHEREAFERLCTLREAYGDTWMKELIELACRLWQRNEWAKHWFSRFLVVDDDVTSWSAFRLFLQCVDSRFWSWRDQIENEVNTGRKNARRIRFLKNNIDSIKDSIRSNEKTLRERLFKSKVLEGQVWPWMTIV